MHGGRCDPRLASQDRDMGSDRSMMQLYFEYTAAARRLGNYAIRPIGYNSWYEIFCRVHDKWGLDETSLDAHAPRWLH
jgi:hypothetical protein